MAVMSVKVARRFLKRNAVKIAQKKGNVSFYKRVIKAEMMVGKRCSEKTLLTTQERMVLSGMEM